MSIDAKGTTPWKCPDCAFPFVNARDLPALGYVEPTDPDAVCACGARPPEIVRLRLAFAQPARDRPADTSAPAPRPPLLDDHAWSVEETGYFLGYSESEVRKLEREGKLVALPRHCNRLLFDPKIVRAFRETPFNVTALRAKVR